MMLTIANLSSPTEAGYQRLQLLADNASLAPETSSVVVGGGGGGDGDGGNSTASHLDAFTYWTNTLLTNVVVVFGLVANALTLGVLSRPSMHSSTNCYLSALAVWDSVVLVCTALLIGLPAVPDMDFYVNRVYAYVVSYVYPLALVAQTSTIWLTVWFTVERYIAVRHPLRAAGICTVSRAKAVTIVISLAAAVYNLPRWFECRPQILGAGVPADGTSTFFPTSNATGTVTATAATATAGSGSGGTIVVIAQTDFGRDPQYLRVYYSWLYLPVMCIVPLTILSAANAFLVVAVRRSRADRKQMNVRQSRENNVTLMLVAVVMVFIVCQVPALVYNLAYAVDNVYTSTAVGYKILSHVRNFLVSLNSAVNFLLYCAFGQKFRRVFLQTFGLACARRCCCCCGGRCEAARKGAAINFTTAEATSMYVDSTTNNRRAIVNYRDTTRMKTASMMATTTTKKTCIPAMTMTEDMEMRPVTATYGSRKS